MHRVGQHLGCQRFGIRQFRAHLVHAAKRLVQPSGQFRLTFGLAFQGCFVLRRKIFGPLPQRIQTQLVRLLGDRLLFAPDAADLAGESPVVVPLRQVAQQVFEHCDHLVLAAADRTQRLAQFAGCRTIAAAVRRDGGPGQSQAVDQLTLDFRQMLLPDLVDHRQQVAHSPLRFRVVDAVGRQFVQHGGDQGRDAVVRINQVPADLPLVQLGALQLIDVLFVQLAGHFQFDLDRFCLGAGLLLQPQDLVQLAQNVGLARGEPFVEFFGRDDRQPPHGTLPRLWLVVICGQPQFDPRARLEIGDPGQVPVGFDRVRLAPLAGSPQAAAIHRRRPVGAAEQFKPLFVALRLVPAAVADGDGLDRQVVLDRGSDRNDRDGRDKRVGPRFFQRDDRCRVRHDAQIPRPIAAAAQSLRVGDFEPVASRRFDDPRQGIVRRKRKGQAVLADLRFPDLLLFPLFFGDPQFHGGHGLIHAADDGDFRTLQGD